MSQTMSKMMSKVTMSACVVLSAACGGGSSGTTDAPATPDAAPDAAPQCGGGSGLVDPEGGTLFVERLQVDSDIQTILALPSGTTTMTRVIAHFLNHQTPEDGALPTAGACNNLVSTMGWPTFVGSPHVDVSVGALGLSGSNAAGAALSLDVPQKPAGTDGLGRALDIYYQTADVATGHALRADSAYDVAFSGATTGTVTISAKTFTGGIFVPATFTVSSPGIDDNGPLATTADYPVTWTPATSANLPVGDTVLGVTWLADASGVPTHMCPTLHSAGTFTIPKASIAEFKAIAQTRGQPTNKVMLIRNAIVHHLRPLPNGPNGTRDPNNCRRVDMLGLSSYAQLMDLQ